jgi:triacylglycerol lipase
MRFPVTPARKGGHVRKRWLKVLAGCALVATTAGAGLLDGSPLPVGHPGATAAHAEAAEPDLVVLVHGMGRTRLSMLLLARTLERDGYEVLNWGYSSTCCTIAELARELGEDLDARTGDEARRVHFVGHSLGNIIVRTLLAADPPANAGRVVMLAPPNAGSHAADRFASLLGWLLRPLPELRTGEAGVAHDLPLPAVEVGVIAGAYDGKVSVEETHLHGEAAHVVVPAHHTFLMNRGDVRRLTLAFLREGRFGATSPSVHAPEPGAVRDPS